MTTDTKVPLPENVEEAFAQLWRPGVENAERTVRAHIAAQAERITTLNVENNLLAGSLAVVDVKLAELKAENKRLREALQKAVECYGKPGGPWNVLSEPGSWIARAKEALK